MSLLPGNLLLKPSNDDPPPCSAAREERGFSHFTEAGTTSRPVLHGSRPSHEYPDSDLPTHPRSFKAFPTFINRNLVYLTDAASPPFPLSSPPSWFDPYLPSPSPAPSLRKVHCKKAALISCFLPSLATTNVRSLGPKIRNFIEDMKMRNITVALVTETWGREDKKAYRDKLLCVFQEHGFRALSLNRKTRRGGGVAIFFDSNLIDFEEVHILVPHNLEVRWGLGRPRNGSIKKIIFCVFYHPPKARKKKALIDHLILTLHSLLSTHNDAEIVIGGDRNELDLFQVFNSIPNLKLLPSAPTHKNKVLDVFATTMWKLYDPPIIVDPVDVDIMGQGKPSDHRCSVLYPISNTPSHRTAEYIVRNVRPLPASRLLDFRSALGDTDFEPVFSAGDTNLADERLLNILHSTMNQHLLIKTLKL